MLKRQPRIGASVASLSNESPSSGARERAAFRRKVGIAFALVTVLGAGSASALFVDFLADRARLRAAATSDQPAVEPKVVAAVPDAPKPALPATREEEAPAVVAGDLGPGPGAKPPVRKGFAKPTFSAVRAIAVATGEGESDPLAPLAVSAYAEESDSTDDAFTAAIDGEPVAIPVAKPEILRKQVAAAPAKPEKQTKPTAKEKTLASLPGVFGNAGKGGKNARTSQSVTMRSSPSKRGGVVTTIPGKAPIQLINCKSWCEVNYKGKRGFIYKRFVARS